MKFEEFAYVRPDMEEVKARFADLLARFEASGSAEEQNAVLDELNRYRHGFETVREIVYIRHTVNTQDPFYEQEKAFFDDAEPVYTGLLTDYYRTLTGSKYRKELEEKWGSQLFRLAELSLSIFKPEVLEDLQLENKLVSEYVKLMASAKIPFNGEELTLSQLTPYQISTDREVRKLAADAKFGFLEQHAGQLDDLYDRLVQIRTQIARKLGFQTFTELAYARLSRTDYGPEQVAAFRRQVAEQIVPVATKLKERQQERIGVDKLYYYDNKFSFPSGNAAPKGGEDWILERGERMYNELSPETGEFFKVMRDRGLLDLASKKGKAGGGYCTTLPEYGVPFIFANFNGTSGDIDVLTHEAGHAFQVYSSRGFLPPEYHFPTYEACEIHSMSMEFLTWPWMELFFEEDTSKYKFNHLSESLLFIPYGVAVDEFQHAMYERPELTPQERKQVWRDIERKYMPHLDYTGNEFLENGGFWQQQSHIFRSPFYYIDYTLAQICAFQFWARAQEDPKRAWADYLRLCKEGGSKSFTELVRVAGLVSPFDGGCVREVIGVIDAWLAGVDDKAL
ncbi:M3 family oligoendopeptidase [Gorillibacterium sp. sgz5001074]|uniref:M3 family oligoendopeptidase n=1 Tax=Gorillibacterium sp. sgz5001074 TaxID=3446695 RepID=UPI003F67FFFC